MGRMHDSGPAPMFRGSVSTAMPCCRKSRTPMAAPDRCRALCRTVSRSAEPTVAGLACRKEGCTSDETAVDR